MTGKKYYIFIISAFLIILTAGCGDDAKEAASDMQKLLPAELAETGFIRTAEVRTFSGNALWEYINGQAELYHQYNFVDVVTANYKKGEIEFEVDIYRFETPDDSYGLYSMFRNPQDDVLDLGVEAFVSPGRLILTKGAYLLKLTGFDESIESNIAMVELAETFEKMLTGKAQKPAAFGQFPAEEVIAKSDKYFAESFLGQKFLTNVYSRDYFVMGDSLKLFLTGDEMGEKYAKWLEIADKTGRKNTAPDGLTFDENYSFIYEDPFHGKIILGLKNKKLVGLVNYSGKLTEYLYQWLETL